MILSVEPAGDFGNMANTFSYYISNVEALGEDANSNSISYQIVKSQCKSSIIDATLSDDFLLINNALRVTFRAFAFSTQMMTLDIVVSIKSKLQLLR